MQNQCDGNANRNDCGRAVTMAAVNKRKSIEFDFGRRTRKEELHSFLFTLIALKQCNAQTNVIFLANTSNKLFNEFNMNSFLFNRFFPLHFIRFQIDPVFNYKFWHRFNLSVVRSKLSIHKLTPMAT